MNAESNTAGAIRVEAMAAEAARFDAASLRAALPAAALGQLASLEVVAEIDSTNAELLRRPSPEAGCAVLLADQQHAGRGSHGRRWASPPGANLYLSLSRRFGGPLPRLAGLSLAVGLAAAEALRSLGADAVALKWPNDLVVRAADIRNGDGAGADGLRKLGGVLVEVGTVEPGTAEVNAAASPRGVHRAVIGLGLNLRMPAEAAAAIDQPWTDLHALLGAAAPNRLRTAAAVIAALLEALAQFDAQGLAPFLPRYAALDALRGRSVLAQLPGGTREALALGVAEDGALRLRIDGDDMRLHAGDVRVRPAGAAA